MVVDRDTDKRLESTRTRLNKLAWLLDSSIRLPGGFRLGLDGIIGLLPGVGDVITAAVSSYIIAKAALLRVPASTLARMGLNVLLELIVGIVPLFGDLFDIVFRANIRNVRLIEAHLDDPGGTRTQSRWIIAGTLIAIVLILFLAVAIIVSLFGLLWARITA